MNRYNSISIILLLMSMVAFIFGMSESDFSTAKLFFVASLAVLATGDFLEVIKKNK